MSILAKFARNTAGNVAVLFALAAIPLTGAVGAAVDYTRYSEARTRLADALDAGVLAVGAAGDMSEDDAYAIVEDWLTVHMDKDFDGVWALDSVTRDDDGKIVAVATGTVETTVARVLGVTEIPITITSEVVPSLGKVEVALVLDNTGSMKGTKLTKLKSAAKELVDSLVNASKKAEDLKIALVPFSQTVNVGSGYKDAAWLDKAGNSAAAKSLFLGQKVNRFTLFQKLGKTWGGCVETRGPAYEATDTLPDAGVADTLYVPYFAPDEPGAKGNGGTYYNSYLNDSKLADIEAAVGSKAAAGKEFLHYQGDILKYNAGNPQGGTTSSKLKYAYGPNSGCEIAPLLRLSTDATKVKSAVDKMTAAGNTDIPIGATWGWNVLAPDGPFADGAPYGDKEWKKFAVIMTDGNNENEVIDTPNLNRSYYAGVGYVWQERMGVPANNTSKSARTAARDQRLGQICAAMKAKGILVYTVRVEVNDGSSDVLLNCASEADMFYDVKNASQLAAAFKDIGKSIQTLRLAK